MAIRAFRLTTDSKVEPTAKAGMTVYDFTRCDYGVAGDDTRAFGYPCRSVTFDPDGDYPFFVVPERDLSPIEASSSRPSADRRR